MAQKIDHVVIACSENEGKNDVLFRDQVIAEIIPEHTASVVAVLEAMGYIVYNGGADRSPGNEWK